MTTILIITVVLLLVTIHRNNISSKKEKEQISLEFKEMFTDLMVDLDQESPAYVKAARYYQEITVKEVQYRRSEAEKKTELAKLDKLNPKNWIKIYKLSK